MSKPYLFAKRLSKKSEVDANIRRELLDDCEYEKLNALVLGQWTSVKLKHGGCTHEKCTTEYEECICGQRIRYYHHFQHDESDEIIHVGSTCVKRWMPRHYKIIKKEFTNEKDKLKDMKQRLTILRNDKATIGKTEILYGKHTGSTWRKLTDNDPGYIAFMIVKCHSPFYTRMHKEYSRTKQKIEELELAIEEQQTIVDNYHI